MLADAGIHFQAQFNMDSGFRRNDGLSYCIFKPVVLITFPHRS